MNIQEMIERRIAELQDGSLASTGAGNFARFAANANNDEVSPGGHQLDPSLASFLPRLQEASGSPNSSELSQGVDVILAQIAKRILELTEQISTEYARLEKELLKSKLEALQNVESALDLTLSMRRDLRLWSCGASAPCQRPLED